MDPFEMGMNPSFFNPADPLHRHSNEDSRGPSPVQQRGLDYRLKWRCLDGLQRLALLNGMLELHGGDGPQWGWGATPHWPEGHPIRMANEKIISDIKGLVLARLEAGKIPTEDMSWICISDQIKWR